MLPLEAPPCKHSGPASPALFGKLLRVNACLQVECAMLVCKGLPLRRQPSHPLCSFVLAVLVCKGPSGRCACTLGRQVFYIRRRGWDRCFLHTFCLKRKRRDATATPILCSHWCPQVGLRQARLHPTKVWARLLSYNPSAPLRPTKSGDHISLSLSASLLPNDPAARRVGLWLAQANC